MEIADVLERGRLEILHAADRRMFVGMRRERVIEQDLVQPAVRLIVHPQPPLFLDDLALLLERVAIDAKRRHSIRFHPQRERQILRGERLPEDSGIFLRVGVAASAVARDDRCVRLGLHVLRALEHHVFEQVREPGATRLLVPRADVIPDRDVHDRRRVILREDHPQPVRKCRDLVIELRRMDRGVQRRHERGSAQDNGRDKRMAEPAHQS